ncbi:hypothetical protein JCM16358_08740 [Halanaerocella petrolearia]
MKSGNNLYKKIRQLREELNQYQLSTDKQQELLQASQRLDELIVKATKENLAL